MFSLWVLRERDQIIASASLGEVEKIEFLESCTIKPLNHSSTSLWYHRSWSMLFSTYDLENGWRFSKKDAALPNIEIMEFLCPAFFSCFMFFFFKHPRIPVALLGTAFSKNLCSSDDPFQCSWSLEQKSLPLFLCMTLGLLILKCVGIACVHLTAWSWLPCVSQLYPGCYLLFPSLHIFCNDLIFFQKC